MLPATCIDAGVATLVDILGRSTTMWGNIMPGLTARAALLLCLACPAVLAQANELPVVRTEAQLKTVLASGRPTPLDALTPHGKRGFLRGIAWREKGVGGFSGTQLVRELNAAQIAEVLAFFDMAAYAKVYSENLPGDPLRLPAPSPALEVQLDRFEQFANVVREDRANAADASGTNQTSRIARHYEEVFAVAMETSTLKKRPVGDLPALFDAAALASNNDPDSPATAHLLAVHREMSARGIDTRRTFDDSALYSLLAARRFSEARMFVVNRPHLGHRKIPTVVDTLGPGFSGRSLYEYDGGADVLTRRAAPPSAGTELVMVVGAGCGFSRAALAALRSDPVLLARLRQANVKLLTPPRSPIPFGYIAEWNAANPTLPLRVAYDSKEWGVIAEASTPEFFLLKDGKLAGHVVGWPEGGNVPALLTMLEAAR